MTVGKDIFFAKHQFRPNDIQGQHTLAHELVHTQQPSSGTATVRLERAPDFDEFSFVDQRFAHYIELALEGIIHKCELAALTLSEIGDLRIEVAALRHQQAPNSLAYARLDELFNAASDVVVNHEELGHECRPSTEPPTPRQRAQEAAAEPSEPQLEEAMTASNPACMLTRPRCSRWLPHGHTVRARKLYSEEVSYLKQYYPDWFIDRGITIEEPLGSLGSHSWCPGQVAIGPTDRHGNANYTSNDICGKLTADGLIVLTHELFHELQRMKGRGAEIVDSFVTRRIPGYDIYEDWDQETTYPDEVLLEFLTANPEAQADIFHKGTAEAGNPPVPGTKFDEVLKLVKNLGKDDPFPSVKNVKYPSMLERIERRLPE